MSETIRNIVIAGEAGQGLVTIGQMLAKALIRSGFSLVVTQGYHSRIRGGHNTFAIRYGLEPVHAPVDTIDVLVAMNKESISLHRHALARNGVILGDSALLEKGAGRITLSFEKISKNPQHANIVALGCVGFLLGIKQNLLDQEIREKFRNKKDTVLQENRTALKQAYAFSKDFSLPFIPLETKTSPSPAAMLNGNEAIALGAMAAGVNFVSYYPMTPATSVLFPLLKQAGELGIIIEQAEDEIAAVNMAIGASYAGATPLVPTSGGGFALMTEGISLAGMTETPLCIVLAQRPGPATGLPTRTEQADLNLVLYAGHGEFPRAVYTPGNIEECFELTRLAVEQAERSQGPVFLLTDQFLADSFRAVPPFSAEKLPAPLRAGTTWTEAGDYARYALTPTGISPRLAPCGGNYLVVADSDEHTEDGHITEDLHVRVAMMDKRSRKASLLKDTALPPRVEGSLNPELLLVCWGSSLGAVREATEILKKEGRSACMIHYCQIWPLVPAQMLIQNKGCRIIVVEGNSTGQFADLLGKELGRKLTERILRYDGLPFTARYILDRLEQGA